MIKQPSSIFNNVIGPVMRGSSSSHVAASARIGMLIRQIIRGHLKEVTVKFDINGSLATTYHGHGSDMGFAGGLLGYQPWDKNLPLSLIEVKKAGILLNFVVTKYEAKHPNTYRIHILSDDNESLSLDVVSTGGGMVEIQKIDNLDVSISGDFYETIIIGEDINDKTIISIEDKIKNIGICFEFIDFSINKKLGLINVKTKTRLAETSMQELRQFFPISNIIQLDPILPIKSSNNVDVPFKNAKEMLEVGEKYNMRCWELAMLYESQRGNISKEEVFEKMKSLVLIMEEAIESGLSGTSYEDRILDQQSHLINIAENRGKIIPGDVTNRVIESITAIMEVKSAMGVIIAAPTAGAAGGLPGTVIGTANVMGFDLDRKIKAMLTAGIVGVFISEHSGFAAEVGGCQVECGAGSGMAAAGLVQLLGGTNMQCMDAASIALQNILGMVCDPVGERVEVPCLGKNVMAGMNAIACANMALSGFDKVVPLDETIVAMDKVGRMLPVELRCTGKGGLSITQTSVDIETKLNIK